MKTIDTCGLSCPQPLMLTKQAIAANYSEMEILVDSQSRCQSVEELLKEGGYDVKIKQNSESFSLIATK
ncbi:MAG: sulfurtransferase TusA family protein [Clostridia bacterium]|nr:sulfurtransferase TusA family protein [Clostridia bacterium]MDD4797994.1 sulfurtransferase TusA family protein [Clostridia bacterium]